MRIAVVVFGPRRSGASCRRRSPPPMALWLLERHVGAEAAEAVAAEIEHPRHGEVWRATPGPRPVA